MKKAEFANDGIGIKLENSNIHYVPNADVISLETLVHIMISKGICSAEELFMLEGRIQELNQKEEKNNFIPIQNNFDRGRFPGLKRSMSKHSWSRRVGTLLFGWKWKKVKKSSI